MCSSMLSVKLFVYSKQHSAHSIHRYQRMRQVVAYRGLKIIKRQAQKVVSVAYRGCSFAGGSNCKALAKKSLVFWIGGRLLEVVAYKRWSHMQPGLYLDAHQDFISAPYHLCVKSLIQDLIIHLFQHFQRNKSICRLTLKAILRAPLSAIFSDKVSLPSTCRMTKERWLGRNGQLTSFLLSVLNTNHSCKRALRHHLKISSSVEEWMNKGDEVIDLRVSLTRAKKG